MLVATWNIRHGGRRQTTALADAILKRSPDVAVLTEYQRGASGPLRAALVRDGYTVLDDSAHETANSVCLAVRPASRRVASTSEALHSNYWIEAEIPGANLRIGGVYLPTKGRVGLEGKRAFWRHLHDAARQRCELPMLMIGDWNTGDSPIDSQGRRPFSCTDEFRTMSACGFVDIWRQRNPQQQYFSWFSNKGSGRRLDHAFVSQSLVPRVRDASYSETERLAGITDHASLVVALA